MIKILIVDDHQILIDSLTTMLNLYVEFNVIGFANCGKGAIEKAKELCPDIIIMDMMMPGDCNGIEAARIIKKNCPEIKILFLSMFSDFASIQAAFDAGADGFTVKNTSGQDFQRAINCTLQDGMYLHPSLEKIIYDNLRAVSIEGLNHSPLSISESERIVLQLLSEGKTSSEIAEEIFRSVETVRSHRKNMLAKFSCANSANLVRFAMEHKLI